MPETKRNRISYPKPEEFIQELKNLIESATDAKQVRAKIGLAEVMVKRLDSDIAKVDKLKDMRNQIDNLCTEMYAKVGTLLKK